LKLLVTGCRGQLGRALERCAPAHGHELVGVDLPELDITDAGALEASVVSQRPDVVVNCAAFTAVDGAEVEKERAFAVNGTAVACLAGAANRAGACLLQISTDYVFAGRGERPWREDDPVQPVSSYGRSKLAGELAATLAERSLVVRTAWLFGEGANFVGAIRRQLEAGQKRLRVVADQTGCPTYAEDLAVALLDLLAVGATGTVHVVNDGSTSWLGFAQEIARQLGASVEIEPITTAESGRPAARPQWSVLDTAWLRSLVGHGLPPWQDALARYLGTRARANF
jgi:dTDP-4-dehydrorhamnose reductase